MDLENTLEAPSLTADHSTSAQLLRTILWELPTMPPAAVVSTGDPEKATGAAGVRCLTGEIITKNKLLSPKESLVTEALSRLRRFPLNGTFQKFSVKPCQARAGGPFCFYERILVPLITISDCEPFRGRTKPSYMFSEPNLGLAK